MRVANGALLLAAAAMMGCSQNARTFSQARIGVPASEVEGLEHLAKGGIFIRNERRLVSFWPGAEPHTPEGRCYAVVVDGNGRVAAKGYLDLEGQDRHVLVMRARDLGEFRQVQEQIGAPFRGPLGPGDEINVHASGPDGPRAVPPNTRLASGVMAEDWARLSDCLMGWPFARRSNDLRCYAAHGGEIPWDKFVDEAAAGTLNTNCPDDVIGLRGRSPSRFVVGGYSSFLGLRIGGGTTYADHPINWRE